MILNRFDDILICCENLRTVIRIQERGTRLEIRQDTMLPRFDGIM
jgi:hypothetical protein